MFQMTLEFSNPLLQVLRVSGKVYSNLSKAFFVIGNQYLNLLHLESVLKFILQFSGSFLENMNSA